MKCYLRERVGDCGVAHNRPKGHDNRFQKELKLFGGEEYDDSGCGAGQGHGNEEIIVETVKGANNDDVWDSGG